MDGTRGRAKLVQVGKLEDLVHDVPRSVMDYGKSGKGSLKSKRKEHTKKAKKKQKKQRNKEKKERREEKRLGDRRKGKGKHHGSPSEYTSNSSTMDSSWWSSSGGDSKKHRVRWQHSNRG